jgi:hypothetical protein
MSAEGEVGSSHVVEGGERVLEAVQPSRGRSLLAKWNVDAGAVLLRERPIACAQVGLSGMEAETETSERER